MQQASGSLANSSICSLHPTLSQAISASSAQHSTFHLEHCVSGKVAAGKQPNGQISPGSSWSGIFSYSLHDCLRSMKVCLILVLLSPRDGLLFNDFFICRSRSSGETGGAPVYGATQDEPSRAHDYVHEVSVDFLPVLLLQQISLISIPPLPQVH